MEKQIISMEAKENIMANIQQLLEEYDYEYTEDAINKIINRWAEQKADLINLLSKHPNYVDGQFLIAFNTDWNREIDPYGAEQFATWIRYNAQAIRELMPEHLKQQRESDFANYSISRSSFDCYYPLTIKLQFLTSCPRRICVSIPK
jgi:hypothetical protein